MTQPRIAYLGTGANGAGIAADMTRAGHDVTLIEQWPAHVEAMRAHGIIVDLPGGRSETTEVTVKHLCEVAELRQSFDLVYLGMKAYDTRWAVELIKPLLAKDGVVIGMQNGMTRDTIASIVGPDRCLGAVIEVTANMYTPGRVDRQSSREESWFALEDSVEVGAERVALAAEVLRAAGTVDVVADIHSAKWMKLAVNAAELVTSALVGLPLMHAAKDPALLNFMLAAGREAVAAAAADGAVLMPILGMPEDVDTSDPAAFADALFGKVLSSFCLPDTETTCLQDWRKGRRNEVHELNGHVVDVAQRNGLRAPLNAFTVTMAERIEAGEMPFDETNRDAMANTLAEHYPELGNLAGLPPHLVGA
ncbi:ketopantoate reductase family protein [Celeribacter sp. SCSIO 80788]|uniref:ketopantoate reductase family protein n=1 Tax=Celeribacter sp. SCSIO 80788 TaxID=3117013 RepID=UPI003DA310CD